MIPTVEKWSSGERNIDGWFKEFKYLFPNYQTAELGTKYWFNYNGYNLYLSDAFENKQGRFAIYKITQADDEGNDVAVLAYSPGRTPQEDYAFDHHIINSRIQHLQTLLLLTQ